MLCCAVCVCRCCSSPPSHYVVLLALRSYVVFCIEPLEPAPDSTGERKPRGRTAADTDPRVGVTGTVEDGGTDCKWDASGKHCGRVTLRLDGPIVGPKGLAVWAEAWDEDRFQDDLIGMAAVPLFSAVAKGTDVLTVPLCDDHGVVGCGELTVRITFTPDVGSQNLAASDVGSDTKADYGASGGAGVGAGAGAAAVAAAGVGVGGATHVATMEPPKARAQPRLSVTSQRSSAADDEGDNIAWGEVQGSSLADGGGIAATPSSTASGTRHRQMNPIALEHA